MRALLVGLAVCVLGAAAYGLAVLIDLRAATAPPTPSAFVQAAWSVYRFGPGHRYHVGQLSLDCQACHQTQANGRFDRPGPGACVACHAARAQIVHAQVSVDARGGRADAGTAAEQVADCVACHGFGPDPEQQANDCLACHDHARGETPAIVTHADVDCKDCHDVHENRVAPLVCTECHSISAEHGHQTASVEQTCLTCHRAHDRAAPAVESCRGCHSLPGPAASPAEHGAARTAAQIPASASFEGHACTGCHAPHGFTKERVAACASCHAGVHALEGKGHAACTSCHAPHAVRESVAQNVCTTCHTSVALQHGDKLAPGAVCTSCHEPHPGAAQATSAHAAQGVCAGCHAEIGAQGQHAHASDMACTACHKPHAFALAAGQTACGTCHAPQLALVRANAGHATCSGCHQDLPHGSELATQACTICHTQLHTPQGHAQCTNCHEPHAGAQQRKACADCHAAQARVGIHGALAGGSGREHDALRCTQCHDQHTTLLAAGVADCSACHVRASLPGLHEVREHAAACTSCHQPHGAEPPGARSACLQCHTDRAQHQPEAKRCEGCHQFVSASQGARRSP